MMAKYSQNSKPISIYQNTKPNNQSKIANNNLQNQQPSLIKQQSKSSTIHNIDLSDSNYNTNNPDKVQTPRSAKKPEIDIKYHKLRESSKSNMKFETSNPFTERIDLSTSQNFQSEIESPTNKQQQQLTQQQHYFTASFQQQNSNNQTTTVSNEKNRKKQYNGVGCCSGQKKDNSNYNLYNEHVCDEDCLHSDDDEILNPNKSNKKKKEGSKNSHSRSSSPSRNPHQITQNLRVTSSQRTPRDKSQSKLAINTINAKLLTTKHMETTSQTPTVGNKQNMIQYSQTNNTINNIGFHTTSSKHMNVSNNMTVSSMYVNPFHHDITNEFDGGEEDENTFLIFGSIKNSVNTLQSNKNTKEQNNNKSMLINTKMTHSQSQSKMISQSKSQERNLNNSSYMNSPNKKGSNIFQEKIEKIQKLQQRVINKSKQESLSIKRQQSGDAENKVKKTSSITPRFDKSKLSALQDYHEEDLIETGDDYVETDPINQVDKNEIQSQPAGNYFSQLEKNYQNISHYTNNQSNPLFLNSEVLNDKLALKIKQHLNQTQQNTSLYSTQSGFFNKQQDDQYLGTLNHFVDAKIQTLHIMIQEKRKLQLLLEEKQNTLKTLKIDKQNQLKQEEIYQKEIVLCQQRQHNLKEQNKDLELQLCLVSEKIIEKSGDYQTQFGDLEHELGKDKKFYSEFEKSIQNQTQKENEIKSQRIKEIDYLKLNNKEADEVLQEFRCQTDHKNNEEKNRVQFMRNKGNDVLKVIQDDKIYSERPNQNKSRDKSLSQSRITPKGTNQVNQHTFTQKQTDIRSTSQIGIRSEKQNQINQ